MPSRDYPQILTAKLLSLYPDSARRASAEQILGRYVGDNLKGSSRVRLAALKIAGSDLNELQRCMDAAVQDFRDILAWAEYPRQMKAGLGRTAAGLAVTDDAEYQQWLEQ